MKPDTPSRAALSPRLARGGAMIMVSQVVKVGVRFGATMTLARLLSASDYGIFGMAAVIYGFFQVGSDLGLTAVGVQRTELDERTAAGLFWLQLLGGGALSILMIATGWPAAVFYRAPHLPALVSALALALVFTGAGSQFRVRLIRDLHYATVVGIESAGLLLGSLAAIAAALAGAGAWALVLIPVVQDAATAIGFFAATRWRPGAWPGWGHLRELLAAAAALTGFAYVNYAALFCDQFLIGRWFGPEALGYYGRGWQLAALPGSMLLGPLTGWMMHALSRLRAAPEEFRAFFRTVIGGLTHLCAPLAALLMAAPETSLDLLLGARWEPAAPILRALAAATFLKVFLFADVWVLLACNAARRLLMWSVVRLGATALALFLARSGGLVAVGWAVAATTIVLNVASCAVLRAVSPVRFSDYGSAIWRPLGLSLGLALGVYLAGPAPAGPLALALAGLVYAGAVFAWPATRREILGLLNLVRRRAS